MASNKVLVIGGGPAGLEAARSAAELGGEVILIEKRERLGGTPDRESYAKLTHHWRDASEAMAELSNAVTSNANVHGLPTFRSRSRHAILQLLLVPRCHHAHRP